MALLFLFTQEYSFSQIMSKCSCNIKKKCCKVKSRNVIHPQITCHPQNILEWKVVHSYQTVSHVCILEAGFRKHSFLVDSP